MARTVKEQEYAERRKAILNATQQLVETKGYEQMTIQDILDTLQISKGAFYYYFDSKVAVLEALVERMGDQVEELFVPIVQDPTLDALDKLLRYFTGVDALKLAQKSLMLAFTRIWYDDENAIFRQKLYRDGIERFTPWLAQVIQQGVEEGIFTTPYPDQAARMIIALRQDLGYAIADLLLSEDHSLADRPFSEDRELPNLSQIAQIAEATADALERVLGATPGCFWDVWREGLARWQSSPTGTA